MQSKPVKKMLAALLSLLVCGFIQCSALPLASAADSAVLTVPSTEGKAGDEIQLDISINAVTDMAGGSFDLVYDPQIVQPIANTIVAGERLKGSQFSPNLDFRNGTDKAVRLTWAKATGSSGSGILCTIGFKLLKAGQSSLKVENLQLFKPNLLSIPCSAEDGMVTVTGGSTEVVSNTAESKADNTPGTVIPNYGQYGQSTGTGTNNAAPVVPVYTEDKPINNSIITGITANPAQAAPGNQVAAALTDIGNHWAKNYIQGLTAMGVISGYADASFKPDKVINRAEFAQIISVALNLPAAEASSAAGFKDWKSTASWARAGIAKAFKANIIKGYEDGTFRPEQPISRSEMAVMIVNAMQKVPGSEVAAVSFTDSSQIPTWARSYVQVAVQEGIIAGKGGNLFKPSDQATRAEAACMVSKLIAKIK